MDPAAGDKFRVHSCDCTIFAYFYRCFRCWDCTVIGLVLHRLFLLTQVCVLCGASRWEKKHEKTHAQMQLLNSSPKFQITEVTGVVTVKGSLFLTELNGRSVLKTLRCLQSCTVPRQGSRNWGSETEFRITYFLSQFSYSWGLRCFGYQFKSFGPSGVLELHGRTCRHTGETFGNSEKNYRGKRPQM